MIDTNPKVGRFVVGEPSVGFAGVHGKIVRISGARIVYDDKGRERFVYRVAAVCDTEAEVNTLLAFDRHASAEISALKGRLTDEWHSHFGGAK